MAFGAGRTAALAARGRRRWSSAGWRCCPRCRASTTTTCCCRSRCVHRHVLAGPALRERGPRRGIALASRSGCGLRALRRRRRDDSVLFTLAITVGAPVARRPPAAQPRRPARHAARKAALLERRREDAAGRAVVDERTRIAGELHDVVAHALSGMTVQATGARRLALTRPELAQAAFEAIEHSGREALDELRRLLGVLRRRTRSSRSRRSRRCATSSRSRGGRPRPDCRSSLQVEGEARELAPGSTSPPTASSRTRSPPRSSRRRGPRRGPAALRRRRAGDRRPRRRTAVTPGR